MVLTDTPGAVSDKVGLDIVGPLPITNNKHTHTNDSESVDQILFSDSIDLYDLRPHRRRVYQEFRLPVRGSKSDL